jgi:hypothetical protein
MVSGTLPGAPPTRSLTGRLGYGCASIFEDESVSARSSAHVNSTLDRVNIDIEFMRAG